MAEEETQPVKQTTVVRGIGDSAIGVAGVDGPTPTLVKPMPAWQLVLVRATRAAIQVFLSTLGVGATGLPDWILNAPPTDFIVKVKLALVLAGGTAIVSALQDTAEFLKGLDVTHPQLRG